MERKQKYFSPGLALLYLLGFSHEESSIFSYLKRMFLRAEVHLNYQGRKELGARN